MIIPATLAAAALVVTGCQGIGETGYQQVSYPELTQNISQLQSEKKPIELHGQVIEFVESTTYEEIGAPMGQSPAYTVEGFLLHVGAPLPQNTLKRVRRYFDRSSPELGATLKGKDLQLVLVRWTAPWDIPQREAPGSDPYPVTPGSVVTVRGVATSSRIERWKHCRQEGDYGCTSLRGVAGPRVEAEEIGDIAAFQFGMADGPLGSDL